VIEGNVGGSRLTPALLAAYRATRYEVSAAVPPFVLRVDEASPALADCHRANGVDCSAFLTAWNPGSVRAPAAANAATAVELERRLKVLGQQWLAGRAVDPAGAWEAEASVLVLGIGRAEAAAIGREFGQAGLVYAGHDAIPRLLLLA
jgi:hypothetical protein